MNLLSATDQEIFDLELKVDNEINVKLDTINDIIFYYQTHMFEPRLSPEVVYLFIDAFRNSKSFFPSKMFMLMALAQEKISSKSNIKLSNSAAKHLAEEIGEMLQTIAPDNIPFYKKILYFFTPLSSLNFNKGLTPKDINQILKRAIQLDLSDQPHREASHMMLYILAKNIDNNETTRNNFIQYLQHYPFPYKFFYRILLHSDKLLDTILEQQMCVLNIPNTESAEIYVSDAYLMPRDITNYKLPKPLQRNIKDYIEQNKDNVPIHIISPGTTAYQCTCDLNDKEQQSLCLILPNNSLHLKSGYNELVDQCKPTIKLILSQLEDRRQEIPLKIYTEGISYGNYVISRVNNYITNELQLPIHKQNFYHPARDFFIFPSVTDIAENNAYSQDTLQRIKAIQKDPFIHPLSKAEELYNKMKANNTNLKYKIQDNEGKFKTYLSTERNDNIISKQIIEEPINNESISKENFMQSSLDSVNQQRRSHNKSETDRNPYDSKHAKILLKMLKLQNLNNGIVKETE